MIEIERIAPSQSGFERMVNTDDVRWRDGGRDYGIMGHTGDSLSRSAKV